MVDQATQRAGTITATPHTVGRERYDRVASDCGIEPRDPFMAIRLIQFCFSLPQAQLEHDGWRKMILRRGMVGVRPDVIRWRKGKEHLGIDFIKNIMTRRAKKDEFSGTTTQTANGKYELSGRVVATDLHCVAITDWLDYNHKQTELSELSFHASHSQE